MITRYAKTKSSGEYCHHLQDSLASDSSQNCENPNNKEEKDFIAKEPRSESNSERKPDIVDDTYVCNKNEMHINSGPRFRYVVLRYGYMKADDTVKLS